MHKSILQSNKHMHKEQWQIVDRIEMSLGVSDRLCGLVVKVSGCRFRGPGFDSWFYQIFWVVVGLEQGPLSLMRSIEELLE
jgi:hypothetical protein